MVDNKGTQVIATLDRQLNLLIGLKIDKLSGDKAL